MAIGVARREEDVVLFFGATAYVFPMFVARAMGKTVIVEPRGDVPLSLQLQWEKRLPLPLARLLAGVVSLFEHLGYLLANAIVTYTPSMADELGLAPYRKKLYTNGARYVDTAKFAPKTPFKDRPVSVGYLGRLDAEKGIPTLVEVAKHLPDNIQFHFIGDGDYREKVERELSEEIENGDVTLAGWVDHEKVADELNKLRLLLLSSEPTEGLPTAILESFACGTPVYATPVSGVPDVVQPGITGYLMTEQDPDTIVTTIERAMETGALVEMSDMCRQRAETEFSFEAAVERYREIIQSSTS